MNILITGGNGYIGTHIVLKFNQYEHYKIIIVDNLSNSKLEKYEYIRKYSKFPNNLKFYIFNLLDYEKTYNLLKDNKIDLVIHLAGLKAVGESINNPLSYYDNNLNSTMNLLKIMTELNIKNIIFSSSATVYGNTKPPYYETSITGLNITNPYGKTKYFQEEILNDLYNSDNNWNIVILRYFNPIGHLYPEFKDDPGQIPNNLFPYILKVYEGKLNILNIFGSDYDTIDGTCERDFIHVDDLATAHYACSNHILNNYRIGLKTYNVGTGRPVSVLELIHKFEEVNNTKINYTFTDRRDGDIPVSYADTSLIYKEIGWKTTYSLEDCVKI
jgi:UDP-glucose 4-epimerase